MVNGYALCLGRLPESETVIEGHRQTLSDRQDLIAALLNSDEFRTRNPEFFGRLSPVKLGLRMSIDLDLAPEPLEQLMNRVARTWTRLGETRPHWSVLSSDAYLPENIGQQEQAFFASGEADVHQLLKILQSVDEDPGRFHTVTEFGCGLGRITNHLADAFPAVVGCDISVSHLEAASRRTQSLGKRNVAYQTVRLPDLGMQAPIDLWYSIIVLQHNPPPVMMAILRRALHLLRPGGLAVFQAPTFAPGYRFNAEDYLSEPERAETFDMHVLPLRAIFELVAETGCRMIDVLDDFRVDRTWVSNTLVVKRPG